MNIFVGYNIFWVEYFCFSFKFESCINQGSHNLEGDHKATSLAHKTHVASVWMRMQTCISQIPCNLRGRPGRMLHEPCTLHSGLHMSNAYLPANTHTAVRCGKGLQIRVIQTLETIREISKRSLSSVWKERALFPFEKSN